MVSDLLVRAWDLLPEFPNRVNDETYPTALGTLDEDDVTRVDEAAKMRNELLGS